MALMRRGLSLVRARRQRRPTLLSSSAETAVLLVFLRAGRSRARLANS
jgi:hypothetical protein